MSLEEVKTSTIPTPEELGFDPAELRRRYAEERAKRLRPDANNQYQEVVGKFEHFTHDPYVKPITRAGVQEDLDALIIGGGFGGLLAAARLQEAGITNFRIIEKAGDFGGTWYWNRYPGAQCDIESYVYLPLLEETGYMPKEKYSFAPEIFAHAQRLGRHYDLYREALFHTAVTGATWHEPERRWEVTTDRGDCFTTRYLILAIGSLDKVKLPAIPGAEDFAGHSFHTSRWDYEYTGGRRTGQLTR